MREPEVVGVSVDGSRASQPLDPEMNIFSNAFLAGKLHASHTTFAQGLEIGLWDQVFGKEVHRPSVMTGVD
jgi:hypothetical protein